MAYLNIFLYLHWSCKDFNNTNEHTPTNVTAK